MIVTCESKLPVLDLKWTRVVLCAQYFTVFWHCDSGNKRLNFPQIKTPNLMRASKRDLSFDKLPFKSLRIYETHPS